MKKVKNDKGQRPPIDVTLQKRLIDAVAAGDGAQARAALEQGAQPNHQLYGKGYLPPLMQAIVGEDAKMARLLLESGASPHALEGEKLSPLSLACEMNGPAGAELAGLLCSFGADPADKNLNGGSIPILAAIRGGRKEAVRAMGLAGFDFQKPVWTQKSSMMYAQSIGMSGMVDLIIEVELLARALAEGSEIEKGLAPGAGEAGVKRTPPRV